MGKGTVDYADILCVGVVLETDAVLSVQSVLDELMLEIELIENGVSVGAFTCCE